MVIHKSQQALLARLFLNVREQAEMEKLLSEIFSQDELTRAARRIYTARALLRGHTYRRIEREVGSSTYVIYRTKHNIVDAKSGLVKELLKILGEIKD